MNDKVHDITMAALLHDIGKFWSRTGNPKPYDEKNKANFGDTYMHALWSGTFIEQYIGNGDIARWARNHHKPSEREECIISLADHLASGERHTDEDQELGHAQDAALVHILTSVALNNKETPELGYLPLIHHGAFQENAFMPQDKFDDARRCYAELWAGFEKAAGAVKPNTAPIETWLALLRRFASRIPAATPTRVGGANLPDISLYEHSRVTAAIAACIAADDLDADTVKRYRRVFDNKGGYNNDTLAPNLCQLVCGDLSGIQEFLYALPRKGAAKTLRARSVMLQIIAAACAEFCCREAGVPACNILYNGGGRFYLLAPASVAVEDMAARLDNHVQDHFGGALAVVIGATPVALSDFLPGEFSKAWERAGRNAAEHKARKYTRRAKDDYNKVFGNMSDYVEVVSSAPGEDSEKAKLSKDNLFIRWGQQLTRARWLVKTEVGDNALDKDDVNRFFRLLGCEYYLVPEDGRLTGLPQALEIRELNGYNPKKTREILNPAGNPVLTYELMANHWPKNSEGNNASFEELADSARGAKKLAVFRADVDNLGLVFRRGLGERATAGRVAMLSQAMADFFEGYLNALCQEDDYKEKLGVIYAGGDDLFIVGAWDAVLDFALELRDAFKRYAFHNPAFSLSGGVVIVEDHLPVRRFADMAGDAEDKAKEHKRNDNGQDRVKDALTLFDMPFGDEELHRFLDLKELLLDVLDGERTAKPVSAGFLRRLFEVWEAYQQERRTRLEAGADLEEIKRLMHWQRWRWMLVYGLRDFAKKANGHADTIQEIQKRILDANTPVDDRLGMPLRWVELLLKKEERRDAQQRDARGDNNETATETERNEP